MRRFLRRLVPHVAESLGEELIHLACAWVVVAMLLALIAAVVRIWNR
jgi:hypothetical protein